MDILKDKRNRIILAVVLLVIVLGLFFKLMSGSGGGYSVVYLSTGEAYVGKLSTFPKMTLTNAYIFQIAADANDPEKSNFQLQPVSQTMWATEKMRLNRKNVIFYGKLSPESEIAKTIAAQANQ